MLISRSGLIRGLAGVGLGAALSPAAARAGIEADPAGAFLPDLAPQGPAPWTRAPGSGQSPLRFAVIGDRTGLARPGVFRQGLKQVSWLQPDFILSVGDLIEGYLDDRAEIARQWAEVDAAVAATGLPFIYTVGNHDVANAETLDAWRERHGPGYYAFTYKGALFIVLNTEDTPKPMPPAKVREFYDLVDMLKADPAKAEQEVFERIAASRTGQKGEYSAEQQVAFGDRQMGFVRDTLARHPSPRWTFVVLHKPAWKMQSPAFAQIQAMLRGRPYTVFAGHTHYFTHEVFDGADYINMGTLGGIRQRNGPGTMDHAMLVTLTRQGPMFANQRINGLMDLDGQTGQTLAY